MQQFIKLLGLSFLFSYLLMIPLLSVFVPTLFTSPDVMMSVALLSAFGIAVFCKMFFAKKSDENNKRDGNIFFSSFTVIIVVLLVAHLTLRFFDYFGCTYELLNPVYVIPNAVLLLLGTVLHYRSIFAFAKSNIFLFLVLLALVSGFAYALYIYGEIEAQLAGIILFIALTTAMIFQLFAYLKKIGWASFASFLIAAFMLINALMAIFIFHDNTNVIEEIEYSLAEEDESETPEDDKPEQVPYSWQGPVQNTDTVKSYFIEYLKQEFGYDFYGSETHPRAKLNFDKAFLATRLEAPDFLYSINTTIKPDFVHLNNIALYIARDSNRLQCFHNEFSALLYYLIPQEVYNTDLQGAVKILLRSAALNKSSNFSNICYRVYTELDSISDKQERMSGLLKILEGEGFKMPTEDRGTTYDSRIFWAYTFWVRRFKENNTGAVLKILTSIDKHYSGKPKEGNDMPKEQEENKNEEGTKQNDELIQQNAYNNET